VANLAAVEKMVKKKIVLKRTWALLLKLSIDASM
jgi:hypothetical protein